MYVQTILFKYHICTFLQVKTVLLRTISHNTELPLELLIFPNTLVLKVLSFTKYLVTKYVCDKSSGCYWHPLMSSIKFKAKKFSDYTKASHY